MASAPVSAFPNAGASSASSSASSAVVPPREGAERVSDAKSSDSASKTVGVHSSTVYAVLRGTVKRSAAPSLPPEISTNATIRQPIRFYASSAASDTIITVSDFRNAILVVGRVSNTSFTPIASSFRVRKITIWNAPNLGSCECAWLASDVSRVKDETKNTATPSGSVTTCKNVFTPPKGSIAYDWVYATQTGTVQMARLSLPQGSIMDVDYEWTTSTGHITESAVNSVSGSVTVGAFYRLYLDRNSGNGYIRPIGFASNT